MQCRCGKTYMHVQNVATPLLEEVLVIIYNRKYNVAKYTLCDTPGMAVWVFYRLYITIFSPNFVLIFLCALFFLLVPCIGTMCCYYLHALHTQNMFAKCSIRNCYFFAVSNPPVRGRAIACLSILRPILLERSTSSSTLSST